MCVRTRVCALKTRTYFFIYLFFSCHPVCVSVHVCLARVAEYGDEGAPVGPRGAV